MAPKVNAFFLTFVDPRCFCMEFHLTVWRAKDLCKDCSIGSLAAWRYLQPDVPC